VVLADVVLVVVTVVVVVVVVVVVTQRSDVDLTVNVTQYGVDCASSLMQMIKIL
jgi:hypothetical protein